MLKKTITYEDYNGNSRTEDFYFNFTQAEIAEMELSVDGGLSELMNQIIKTQNQPAMIKLFKDLVLRAYGEKSADGKRFVKVDADGHKLANNFAQTEAYSVLFMELATNEQEAIKFCNAIIPKNKEAVPAPQA